MPENLVAGWTEPVKQQLLADGTAVNGTGVTLDLDLRDRSGGKVSTAGKVTWSSAATGIAQYTPAAGDLKAEGSPYTARWVLTASSEVAYYPNSKDGDVWTVGR